MSIGVLDGAAATVNKCAPSNPTGTTSTSYVMAGLGLAGGSSTKFGFTPIAGGSGKVAFIISSFGSNTTNNQNTAQLPAYGTGTAPTNGAAATGTTTQASGSSTPALTNAGGFYFSLGFMGVITGLTAGTAYWMDLQFNASANTANIANAVLLVWDTP